LPLLRRLAIHVGLLSLTFLTTTFAGVQWLNRDPLELTNFVSGLPYGILIITMLLSHEMGHYLAAVRNKVSATLPYFLPFPSFLFFGFFPFGTLGAVIRLQSAVTSRRALFDIGVTGPIAGFIVSVIFLIIGFVTLPTIDYLYTIHPEYVGLDKIPAEGLTFGTSILYNLLAAVFSPRGAFIPPMNEIYHYPFLCVGWFGLFVTAMNLLPIGQLDGGHIVYAMFGQAYHRIAQGTLIGLMVLGTLGFLPLLGIPFEFGWTGWLFWAVLLVFFMRRTHKHRPPVEDATPLPASRMLIGWLAILVFFISFSITPLSLQMP
jgi:membrane-associated protease RseP (regulator of RpoE activity)